MNKSDMEIKKFRIYDIKYQSNFGIIIAKTQCRCIFYREQYYQFAFQYNNSLQLEVLLSPINRATILENKEVNSSKINSLEYALLNALARRKKTLELRLPITFTE
ncbi:hypothetical protein HYW75_02255 [Candidatus Pacearchaeota archaeon]|nr:hypothetical protein [Candidatus Pacearchaeota archaeon]